MKPPAFQLYAQDFMEGTAHYSMTELGCYFRLVCFQWTSGALPDDASRLANLCRMKPRAFEAIWKVISEKFELGEDGKLRNPRLEMERQNQAAFRELQSAKGKRGNEARWGARQESSPDSRRGDGSGDGSGDAPAITAATIRPSPDGRSSVFALQPSSSTSKSKAKTKAQSTPLASPAAMPDSRGKPIPPDFQITEKHRAWASKKGLPDPALEIEAFRDYWQSRAGPGRLKRDWDATFRTWLRRASGSHGTGSAGGQQERDREVIERAFNRVSRSAEGALSPQD